MNSNNSIKFVFNQLVWMLITFGICLLILLVVPFPISMVIIIGILLFLNIYLRKRMTARISGIDWGSFGSSNDTFCGIFKSRSPDRSLVKYYCMSCGSKHKQVACPKCGSKIKRAGY
ncbi:MAG TPA: hypothetical protein VEL11_06880 [Candidatus Bathyarchaeia archaeon]|nr:hypothetical protein [Candidatus Bathyarchaeia archaeon]